MLYSKNYIERTCWGFRKFSKITYFLKFVHHFYSMRTSSRSRPPEQLSSDSSDSETEEESLFGPQCLAKNPKYNQQRQRSMVDCWAETIGAEEAQIRRGSDRELKAFINMRDQADTATEVTDSMWCSLPQHTLIHLKSSKLYICSYFGLLETEFPV